jgi:hypothetical protein
VVLHGLLEGAALGRARAAWLRAEPACRTAFEVGARAGGGKEPGNSWTYSIPNLLELDDVFVDLADHPKVRVLHTGFLRGWAKLCSLAQAGHLCSRPEFGPQLMLG